MVIVISSSLHNTEITKHAMQPKKSNKVSEIIKLQQILQKKRPKIAQASKQANNNKINKDEDSNNLNKTGTGSNFTFRTWPNLCDTEAKPFQTKANNANIHPYAQVSKHYKKLNFCIYSVSV